jgi:hypothetical protein
MRARAWWLAAAFIVCLGFSAASAFDRPIDGQKLMLRRAGGSARLVFVSRDPSFAFPSIGGPDDPGTGSPGGATIELFSQSEGQAALGIPAGAGDPGWTADTGTPPRYKFHNGLAPGGISPVCIALLRQGKTLKLVAKDAGLPLAVPQGALGIRITTGGIRNCARFTGTAIRKDQAGTFIGSHADSDALSDCSHESLNGIPPTCSASEWPACGGTCTGDGVCVAGFPNCVCVSPSSPCGDTAPMCSGTCPAGEECAPFGPGPFNGCGCIPAGSTPCGDPGAPVCGGTCPTGTACRSVITPPSLGAVLGCTCAPPGPCGAGGDDCGNGFACAAVPPMPFCVPIYCSGGDYPSCGGSCVSGAACQPFKLGEFTTCLCAVPAPCDSACGGYTCAGGDVCTVDIGPPASCGCGAP